MKRGILFFYHMGIISTVGRILLLPLIWMLTKFVPPAYYVCLVLFIFSLLVAMVPAPSDKSMMNAIRKYRDEAKREMKEKTGICNEEQFLLLNGYRKKGSMKLRRHVDREVIYPYPTSFVFAEHKDKKYLLIAKKSLLKATPTEYELIKLHDESEAEAFRIEAPKEFAHEAVGELTVYTKNAPEGIAVFAKNDYHYRDFLKAVQSVVAS